MSALFTALKGIHCISSVTRTYHISHVNFKWPVALKPRHIKDAKRKHNVRIWENMTLWDLAKSLRKDLNYVEEVLKPQLGPKLDPLSGQIVDFYSLSRFLKDQNLDFTVIQPPVKNVQFEDFSKKSKLKNISSVELSENEVERPPVVTIMGHVDHGKTTLLDALRNSNIVAGEFGGITQHIGAFSVSLKPGKTVTFIDTPGHAAFGAMRNRGAEATDIVVLIVAADDGVMEQTVESIKMATNAGVPIIVAVNKIDKASSDLTNIKKQLMVEGVQAEDLGGNVQVIPISALKKINLNLLVEAILLEAEMMSLKGDPEAPVEGIIIESFVNPKGKCATIIIKRGTLRKRVILISGSAMARVRGMFDSDGQELSEVTLSQPALITGWRDLPAAGEIVREVSSEKEARLFLKDEKKISLKKKYMEDYIAVQEKSVQEKAESVERKNKVIAMLNKGDIKGLKEFYLRRPAERTEKFIKLDIIIKGDVDGSVDAILNVLETYDSNDRCKLSVIHHGIGVVTPADIELASTFDATIYCFNLDYPQKLKNEILDKNIRIRFHNIIYKFIDDLKAEISDLLPPKEEEEVIGSAEVLDNFMINVKRTKVAVAGCLCVTGELRKNSNFKVVRNGEVIHNGKIRSLKHFKNEVNTIKKDTQCGIMFADFSGEFQSGDKIICYETIIVKHPLDWNTGF